MFIVTSVDQNSIDLYGIFFCCGSLLILPAKKTKMRRETAIIFIGDFFGQIPSLIGRYWVVHPTWQLGSLLLPLSSLAEACI